MSLPTGDHSDANNSSQICTYILRIDSEDDIQMSSAQVLTTIQTYLGSEHEVLSADKLKLHSPDIDSSAIHNVLKIKTTAPSLVANKLLGNASWVRKDHILFKSLPRSS
ncbi:hypothetical protein ACHAWC_007098 [Mediolabrus comicus]